jgi:hypothetical protein
MIEKGDKLPPVKVYLNNKGILICQNGAHRTMAAKMSNMNLFVKTKASL